VVTSVLEERTAFIFNPENGRQYVLRNVGSHLQIGYNPEDHNGYLETTLNPHSKINGYPSNTKMALRNRQKRISFIRGATRSSDVAPHIRLFSERKCTVGKKFGNANNIYITNKLKQVLHEISTSKSNPWQQH
jgi:hypothetical protein